MANELFWVFTLRLKPGQLQAFKTMVSEIVPLAEKEPGTLAYQWSLNHDQTIAHIYERYSDSDAFVSHVNDTFGAFADRFMSMVDVLSLVVYGEPDAECRKALDTFNATYMTLFCKTALAINKKPHLFHLTHSTIMKLLLRQLCSGLILFISSSMSFAAPAINVLGKDFTFPNKIAGLPEKLSDFKDLQINHFKTSDGVKLAYWEAGTGKPLVFIPGWSANGAEYLNVMYLLSQRYHVYVLDPRNQGLSEHVDFGMRISRFAADLKELNEHLGLKKADYCGWSMGASVLWSYIDLYGTQSINKIVFIDEPPSIYSHADWSEKEHQEAGAITSNPERMIDSFTSGKTPNTMIVNSQAFQRAMLMDSPYFQNSESFAQAFIKNNIEDLKRVMFDHVTNDWRDVIRKRINVPTAIFTGVYSDSLNGQRWIHATIPNSELHVYTAEEQGDHFLAFKNPRKFTAELDTFLSRP